MLFLVSRYLNFVLTFHHVEKRLDLKDKVNFRIDDVTAWLTNNCNTHIARSKGNPAMRFGQLIEHNMINIFLEK